MPIATKICNLVNSKAKPAWWRYTLNQAIEMGELTDKELETAYSVAKMEFGLEAIGADYERLTGEAKATGYHAEIQENKILSVGNTQYISTLAPEKKLTFSPTGLTVIYGNNGAGKSSYAKILKNACLTRGEAPTIRQNVFSASVGVPVAEIEIESNGKNEIVPWSLQSEANSCLKSIRVFDSQSSNHYLAKSENLHYKPAALKLLDELLKTSNYIAARAKHEELQYSACNIIPQMNFGTSPSALKITSKLNSEYVDSLCATVEEIAELKELRKEVVELTNNSPQTLKDRYIKRKARVLPLQSFLTRLVDSLSAESIKQYKDTYLRKEYTKSTALKLSKETFAELPIENIGSEDWLAMWQAAKTFIQGMEQSKSFPPKEGENCPTCLQKIDASTAVRLVSFDDYLRSSLQKDADLAAKTWDVDLKKVKALDLNTAPYDAILNEIKEKDNVLGNQFDALIQQLISKVTKMLKDEPEFLEGELEIVALTKLNTLIRRLEEAEKAVQDDEQKAATIKLKQQRIFEVEDKEKIALVRQQIISEIDKAKKREAYDKVKRSTSTSALTRLNNEICSSSSIGRMQEFFNMELAKLGFKHFELTALTKGAKGNQKYSIQLPDNRASIMDIASEGEQKCISLAGFFAELNTDNRKSAIIFDDPVNSLDHVWRLKFARRIVEESESRQVIVFTHDLPFMKMIQETSDKVIVKAITRGRNITGIPLDTPPWDALKTNSRLGILKDAAIRARKAADNSLEDYQYQAGIIYGKMRETWERLIEEWLIRGVVERFNREVKTQSCRYLIDIDEIDIKTINSAMSKCSTYMNGHDMAEEAAGSFPDIDELDQDISSLEQYLTVLKKRRK
ncbi:AAA family ATPase [Vibrio splendidus]|uniref:AAA family ATPase n=1 Tax=Vibrio sp. 10N.261.54.A5 TaxID=3229686 RepID=UPI00354B835D